MPRTRLVAVSYPVNEDYTTINTEVLGVDASLVFLQQEAEADRAALAAQAEALIGWNPGRELPDGALFEAAELKFIQVLSAGVDSVDFTKIPEHITLAGNVG